MEIVLMPAIKKIAQNKFRKELRTDDVLNQLVIKLNELNQNFSSFLEFKNQNSPDKIIQQLGNISGPVLIDLSQGLTATATIIGNTTFEFSNLLQNKLNSVTLVLTNPGVGTLVFPSGTVFDKNVAPVLLVDGSSVITFESYNNGVSWIAVQIWRSET
jgi:hypothetical protein